MKNLSVFEKHAFDFAVAWVARDYGALPSVTKGSRVISVREGGRKVKIAVVVSAAGEFQFSVGSDGCWETLCEVDSVLVVSTDDPADPDYVDVFIFASDRVIDYFDECENILSAGGFEIEGGGPLVLPLNGGPWGDHVLPRLMYQDEIGDSFRIEDMTGIAGMNLLDVANVTPEPAVLSGGDRKQVLRDARRAIAEAFNVSRNEVDIVIRPVDH